MFKLFKKNKDISQTNEDLMEKIASLLIHAAKIDENYTNNEKEIIKKALIKLGANPESIDDIMTKSEIYEEKSNQILDFTKEIKNVEEDYKIQIIECLWEIIYSNDEADMYEANLMRRLSGLLYLDNKTVGDIKEKIKKKILK